MYKINECFRYIQKSKILKSKGLVFVHLPTVWYFDYCMTYYHVAV